MKLTAASTLIAAVSTVLPASLLSGGTYLAESRVFYTVADGLPSNDIRRVVIRGGDMYAVTVRGAAKFTRGKWSGVPRVPDGGEPDLPQTPKSLATGAIRQVASHADGRVAVAAADGLFLRTSSGRWRRMSARDERRSWLPFDVRGVAFDSKGRLWFASPQGVGCLSDRWQMYTPEDGLPFDDFTTVAASPDGAVWFGTTRGAIRFDGAAWEYRAGLRWLPADEVRSIAVDEHGAWFATPKGVGRIVRTPATLSAKAKHFEEEIDRRHRRTAYGYVESVAVKTPGDASEWTQHDSDNDGLWTAMYAAGECFAYGATGDPRAKERAKAALEALMFLGEVTRGGSHPAPNGFVARTILPASGPDPNATDTPERDRQFRATRDRLWKVMTRRWPLSADGKWYWKADTSSDELDGHYFFYAVYYDLVAGVEAEKVRVRGHVAALTDHLIEHGFNLVDHDGKPTRWGVFSPEALNHDPNWREERGLNSLSILSYLRTAEHITGDPKYGAAARTLIDRHGYAVNVAIPKTPDGPGSGNQSDDEMAFMNFYCLLKYEKDPVLKRLFALAFFQRWRVERPELNPLFNFLYAASATGLKFQTAFDSQDLSPDGDWLQESIDTLRRYPLDRFNWGYVNSHRKDVVLLPVAAREGGNRGLRRDGRVVPIDERFVDKWNHDPWALDGGGDGRRLADGGSFLLPYYLGLYYKFVTE